MLRSTVLAALFLGLAIVCAPVAEAGNRGPHPVFAWKGNEFLFEVKPHGKLIYLTGYRAVGSKWQLVGTTTIRKGQRAPEHGFLQDIWFGGRRLGQIEADLSNPWWRYYPGEDRNGFELN